MDNSTFHNPTRIIFGKDAVRQIGGVIKEAGVKRVLLVAGGGSIRKNGVYDIVARSLKEAGLTSVEAWGVGPTRCWPRAGILYP
jgi:alcohol dehydrogenase